MAPAISFAGNMVCFNAAENRVASQNGTRPTSYLVQRNFKASEPNPAEKIKTLSDAQQKQILRATEWRRGHLFVALGIYAGLRKEESAALMWTDILEVLPN